MVVSLYHIRTYVQIFEGRKFCCFCDQNLNPQNFIKNRNTLETQSVITSDPQK